MAECILGFNDKLNDIMPFTGSRSKVELINF